MPTDATTPTADDLTRRSAAELATALAAGEVSSVEVTRAHLDRIAAVDGGERGVHAFMHVAAEAALAAAGAVDTARAAGEELPPLAGVPVAVKDVMTTVGMPTTCGSRILSGWVPPYDATVVRRLRDARLVILGKTNMDEFAMGSSTEHSAYGPTRNPWDLDRIPGGSGGGSAAAVAAFEAPLATGTDTGGSIRQPAAVTGTVGVKPTYGGVSRYGIVAMASSLDQPGPCGRTVLDTALLHEVMAGYDPMDSTSLTDPVPPVVEAARQGDVAGMRIAVVRELSGDGYQDGVRARFSEAVDALVDAGAKVVEVSCPSFTAALGAYYLIMPSEVSSNLARFDAMRYGLRVPPEGVADPTAEQVMCATRAAGFGAEVKRRIILGTYALSSGYYDAYYGSAQKVRTLIQATSPPPSPRPTSSCRPPRRPRRSGWGRSSTTRWPCTSTTSRPSRSTWPGCRGCRCRPVSPTRTACRSGSRSSPPPGRTTGSTGSARPWNVSCSPAGAVRCSIARPPSPPRR